MRIQISDHQDKAARLKRAVTDSGHELVDDHADILLIDWDGPVAYYPKRIERAYSEGAEVYLYSHGAMPLTCWDGIWKPGKTTRGYLAQTPGEKGVFERYHYPYPIEVIGWHYCDIAPFQPCKEIKRVLFAPWHPQGNGWLLPEGIAQNQHVFKTLLQIPDIEITVRHARDISQNGLPEVTGVNYILSNMQLESAVEAIDAYDLVVSYATVAYLAIARGKPTVMFGQDVHPHDGYSPDTIRYVEHWEAYREYMRYPYDISSSKPKAAWNIMCEAATREPKAWKKLFIGKPFDPKAFVKLLERLVGEKDNAQT